MRVLRGAVPETWRQIAQAGRRLLEDDRGLPHLFTERSVAWFEGRAAAVPETRRRRNQKGDK